MSSEAYQHLLEEHQRLQAEHLLLQRLLHLFAVPDDFDLVFDGVMDALMDHFGAQAGSIYMVDGESGELYFATARGPAADHLLALDMTIPPGKGIAGACFQDKQVIAVSEAHKDPRFAKEIAEKIGYEVRSMLTAPMIVDGEALGVIQVINRKGEPTFSSEDVELISKYGRYAGGLIGLGLELSDLSEEEQEA
jgi:GAF domain-containing protein